MRTLTVLLGCTLLAFTAQAQHEKPNIIVIYADDLGYGDLSCYGMQRIKTPNIDRLAQKGLRFTQAYATSATCTPSRFGLLTGKYPWKQRNTGIAPGDASLIIPTDRRTMPGMLQDAGYRTAVVGKWHLGLGEPGGVDWNGEIRPGPLETGFSYAFIMPATLDRVPCVYVENRRVVNLDAADPIQVSYKEKVGNMPTATEHPEKLRMLPEPGHGHNQTIVDSISRIGWMSGGASALWKDADIAGDITRKTQAFIRDNARQPFFVYFATGDIHVPRYPHSQFRGKSGMGLRGDAILQLDWSVGQIMQTLDSLQLTRNTLVILTSDNGPVLNDGYLDEAEALVGNHRPAGPLRGGKYSAFEAGARVPFIVQWPEKIRGGASTDVLFSQVDLFASLAKLTGQPLRENEAPDSFDMLPQLLGRSKKHREFLITQGGPLSIISNGWKYITPSKGQPVARLTHIELGNLDAAQLYDLRMDKGERRNEAASRPNEVKALSALLEKIKTSEKSR